MDVETSEAIAELGQRIDTLERSLGAEFRDGLAENRRHTDVQFEAVRDDIRILAEGFATVSADLAQHRVHTEKLFEAVRAEMSAVRSEFRTEMAGARSEFRNDVRDARSELRNEMTSVGDDIRALTASVAAISAKLDSRPG